MLNLAGKPTAEVDQIIENELTRCGIEVLRDQPIDHPEVKATICGRLGNLRFTRHWYYWGVTGRVPLEVAQRLYADPAGRTDIRVDGHCGCPPPERWVQYYSTDGVRLLDEKNRPEWTRIFKDELESVLKKNNSRFSPDPSIEGKPCIESYHIDSELGLYIFCKAIKGSAPTPEATHA